MGYQSKVAVIFLVSFCSLVALEAMARVYYFITLAQPLFGEVRSAIALDPRKGWKATPFISESRVDHDAQGNAYKVVFNQYQDGFRQFDDLAKRPRLLAIGDSFTQAYDASDGKTWMAEVGRRLEAQVFAYGVGGYGTLQELMALEEFLEKVDPDVIVLQVCTNDVINNSLKLERRSLLNNNSDISVRPYASPDGTILYARPARDGLLGLTDEIPPWLQGSRVVHLFRRAVVKTYIRLFAQDSVELAIAKDPSMPLYKDALATTEALFALIKKRAGSRPVYAFISDNLEPFRTDLQALLRKMGFSLIPGIPGDLDAAKKDGHEVLAWDKAHWDEAGHEVVGKAVARQLAATYFSPRAK